MVAKLVGKPCWKVVSYQNKTLQNGVQQRFILGLLSISIFINDLEDEIVLIKFANEVKQEVSAASKSEND